jgi:predicted PhzF superfamily epimerase YddE/YHI9
MRRILVSGGREFGIIPKHTLPTHMQEAADNAAYQQRRLTETLNGKLLEYGVIFIIHGKAKGADSFAGAWAFANGMDVAEYPANWSMYGKAAGYYRNLEMLEDGEPDEVIAFEGGNGTEMMIKLTNKCKVPLTVVE